MTKVSIILEKAGGTTNCYDGNIWDNSFCPDPATCNANCEMGNHLTIILFAGNCCNFNSLFFLPRHIILSEGCESADWAGTYGVTASGSGNTKSLSSFIFCHHYFCPHICTSSSSFASSFLHFIVIVIIHEFQQDYPPNLPLGILICPFLHLTT